MPKISELLSDTEKQNLVLPEFQREYVWTREQAKQLMVSLFKGYPIGGLLVWKTDQPPELKNVDRLPDKLRTIQVLLDGQQRLTTLHMLMTGRIPIYYQEKDIENDPRDLRFHLKTGDFQYYQAVRMAGDPMWYRVVECFSATPPRVMQIAGEQEMTDQERFELAGELNDNLNKLRAIKDADLPTQTVPPHANLDEAIDIFDRVNSQGTKLTEAELALTHVTGKWPVARRILKEKMDECAGRRFDFSLNFMTRALVATVTGRALFEQIHPTPREQLEDGWKRLDRILDYTISFLPHKAFIHSTDDLNTTNALIPIVAYLARNGGSFSDQTAADHAVHWLYAALTWARYTAQTDQRLEADLSKIAKEVEPWDELRSATIDQRGRIEVKPSDYEGRTAQHPLYRMTFILTKTHGAVDWFNGLPLAETHGPSYGLHSHHIFPQSLLYKSDWDADNYTHRQAVNEIANRAFLTAMSNINLSNQEPAAYLPEIESKYPGALKSQFVPMDPELWRIERFSDFLATRRELIARKLNEYMTSLVAQPEPVRHRPIQELIGLGESAVLEFKSTLQWDKAQNRANRALRQQVLKTVAAFMNTDGGTLVIGVEDDGNIYGLEQDLKLVGASRDRFEQTLVALVTDHLGAALAHYYRIRFEAVNGRDVCIIDVDPVRDPVFVRGERGQEFYTRVGNTTRALDPEETLRYREARVA
jgi:hypothetical protein